MFAEIVSNFISTPFEVIKQQMQIGNESNMSTTIQKLYKKKGIRTFYIGLIPFMARGVPFSIIQMPLYEEIKKLFLGNKRRFLTIEESIIGGFISGSVAGFMTNPIDVIKTNMMTQNEIIYSGFADCGKKIYLEEGIMVFSKGILHRTILTGFVNGIFFVTYEFVRKHAHLEIERF